MQFAAVQKEFSSNEWFRLATIGGFMLVVAAIINVAAAVMRNGFTALSAAMAVLTVVLYAAYMGLMMYSNYCLMHGRCNVLAGVQGVLALLAGSLALLTALVAAFATPASASPPSRGSSRR